MSRLPAAWMTMAPPKLVVVLHARDDDDHAERLTKHLRRLTKISGAEMWAQANPSATEAATEAVEATRKLEKASLVLVLVSVHHMPGDDGALDAQIAAAQARGIRIVPIRLAHCLWEMCPLRDLEWLPRAGETVVSTPDRDQAWTQIVRDVASILEQVPAPESEPPPPPPPPVIPPELREAADSADGPTSAAAFIRIIGGKEDLTADDEAFLAQRIPTLPRETMLNLVWRYGTLGVENAIVERLAAEMPAGPDQAQRDYVSRIGAGPILWGRGLSEVLGDAAYGRFVDAVRARVEPPALSFLVEKARGCGLFNRIVDAGGHRPFQVGGEWRDGVAATLLDVRADEEACRRRLEERIDGADIQTLLPTEHVLFHAGCEDLAERAGARLRAMFCVEWKEDERGNRGHHEGHWQYVARWASAQAEDHAARIQWLGDRLWSIEKGDREYRWGKEDDALRLEAARSLADRGKVASWALDVLEERLKTGAVEAWRLAFSWWRPMRRAWDNPHAELRRWILLEAPLPAEVPDDFDERFLKCVRDEMAHEERRVDELRRMVSARDTGKTLATLPTEEFLRSISWGPEWHYLEWTLKRLHPPVTLDRTIPRLLDARLTPPRATWIARFAKEAPSVFEHPKIDELSILAEPMSPEDLPPPEDERLRSSTAIEAYRRLTGAEGDARLRAMIREEIGTAHERRTDVEWLLESRPWISSVANDALRAELRYMLRGANVLLLAWVHEHAPWLLDKAALHEEVRQRLDEDGWSGYKTSLPSSLFPLVLERARRTDSDHELRAHYEWLVERGLSRRERFNLLMGPNASGSSIWVKEMAALLAGEAEWRELAPPVLERLVQGGGWPGVYSLLSTLRSAIEQRPPGPSSGAVGERSDDQRAGFCALVHRTLATAILRALDSEVPERDEPRTLALVDALRCLRPGDDPLEKLISVRERPHLSDAVKRRIDEVRAHLLETPARATFDALMQAVDAAFAPTGEEIAAFRRRAAAPADEDADPIGQDETAG